jgi:two-component system chemotaxis sensor kinase CheA
VKSSVAFDDKETAREVFDAVAQDPDVAALTLVHADGRELHRWGAATFVPPPGANPGGSPFRRGERIIVLTPVTSLEGPRGTLALELSTAGLALERARLLRGAAIGGSAALLLGAVLAWLLARSFARRLAIIADVARGVSAGDLKQAPIADDAGDEIGTLARAFNTMLQEIDRLVAHIRDQAQAENERLEAKNADMRRVLDNVEQGLVSVELDGRIGSEHSAALTRWLGPPPPSRSLWDWLERVDPGQAAWGRVAWEQIAADALPLEVTIEQLPNHLETEGARHVIEYRPIFGRDQTLDRMLVVISDVTARVERERAELEQRELATLAKNIVEDRFGSQDFMAEMEERILRIASDTPRDDAALMRDIHTVKGGAAIFGLESVARLCHRLEGACSDGTLSLGARQELSRRWEEIAASAGTLLGQDNVTSIELPCDDYERLLASIEAGASIGVVKRQLMSWKLEPTVTRLRRLATAASQLAHATGKGSLEVVVDDQHVRLRPGSLRTFWSAFSHLVRNAIDHGLEAPDERRCSGKSERPRLVLRSRIDERRLYVEIEDDGRGIDWEGVRARARAMGLRAESHDDLVDALCADGLSTRSEVTATSGRGFGLAAVREVCRGSDGRLAVESTTGRGTCVSVSWPLGAVAIAARPSTGRARLTGTGHESRASTEGPCTGPASSP